MSCCLFVRTPSFGRDTFSSSSHFEIFCHYPLSRRISFARLNRVKTLVRAAPYVTFSGARRTGNFFNQAMWVHANRDGALRALTAGSILITVRDSGRECALIFRLKMLRRVARAAVEMHLIGGGAALEGRRPSYNRSQMFCAVTVTSPVVCARDRSGLVYDRPG